MFRKKILYCVAISAIIGVGASILLLYIGLQNNSQNEFYDTSTNNYDYLYISKVFFINFFVIGFFAFLINAFWFFLLKKAEK